MGNPVSFQQTATLKYTDYPNGLASQDDVAKFFTQMGPFVASANSTTQQAVTRESQTFKISMPISDWQPVGTALRNAWAAGPFTPNPTCQDGTTPAVSLRLDMAGNVWFYGNVSSAAATGIGLFNTGDIPPVYRPEVPFSWVILANQTVPAAYAAAQLIVNADGSALVQITPAHLSASYNWLVSWPAASRVPGFAGASATQVTAGVGFPIKVQFSRSSKPASIRLSLVESGQDPSQTQKTTWLLGQQAPHVAIGVCWSWLGGGIVSVDAIPGLALGAKYTATIEAFY